ncbi:hypothetical protein GCM10027049_18280 [Mucilaginibacter puniceus]
MKTQDFTTTILVDNTPQEVFSAINQPQQWWSGEFTGYAEKLNDEFTYRYKDMHYSKQKVAEMVADKKVVWLVTESRLNFIDDKSEWTGTRMIFEIAEKDNKTELRFTHEGLTPKMECYDSCEGAWTELMQRSLFKFITTGERQQISLD